MCIIAYQQPDADKLLTLAHFEGFREANPDGMGIMYSWSKELKIFKTLDDLEGVYKEYLKARNLGVGVAIHFRRRTSGEKDVDNCHPFVIHSEEKTNRPLWALMHNGSITGIGKIPDEISDTRHFTERIMARLPVNCLQDDALAHMIASVVSPSRLLVMDNLGRVSRINKNSCGGSTCNSFDTWFSHGGWRSIMHPPKQGKKKKHHKIVNRSSRYCHSCRSSNHWTSECLKEAKKLYCCKCWKRGHAEENCPLRKGITEIDGLLYNGMALCFECGDSMKVIRVGLLAELQETSIVPIHCSGCRKLLYEPFIPAAKKEAEEEATE